MSKTKGPRKNQDEAPRAVVAYLRVSTDGQEEGNGLDVQRQTIAAFAAANKIEVSEWLEDVISGAKEDRPRLDMIRELASAGKLGTVLVYKLDRFARDTRVALNVEHELKLAGCRVISASEFLGDGPIGEMMKTILFAFATFERSQIATRTKAGRREAGRNRGTFNGGPGVLGYRPAGTKGAPGKGALSLVEGEMEAIRSIFRLRSNGLTLQAIADDLNLRGHRTLGGAQFQPTQVHRVLGREAFYKAESVLARSYGSSRGAHVAILE